MSRSDTFPLNVWRSCCMQHLTELVVNAPLVIKTDEDQEDYRHLRVLLDRFESKVRHLARVNLDVISSPFVHRRDTSRNGVTVTISCHTCGARSRARGLSCSALPMSAQPSISDGLFEPEAPPHGHPAGSCTHKTPSHVRFRANRTLSDNRRMTESDPQRSSGRIRRMGRYGTWRQHSSLGGLDV